MTQQEHGIFIYDIDSAHDGKRHFYVSPLSHEQAAIAGLRPEAIMGELTGGAENLAPEHFQQNKVFIRFLAWVIGKHAPQCPGLIAETRRQQNGYVYILDRRTPSPADAVPSEDIIGAVEIQNGRMLQFQGSQEYRVLTNNGFMKLDGWIHARLIEELAALAGEQSA